MKAGFPKSISEMDSVIRDHSERIAAFDNRVAMNKRVFEGLERNKKQIAEFVNVLKRLKDSWQHEDPGKDFQAYFFLNKDRMDRVVVKEFLDQGVKYGLTETEWEKYKDERNRLMARWKPVGPYDRVPPWYPVLSLKDVASCECPGCKREVPVIEWYYQTEDNDDGNDTWEKKQYSFCVDCRTMKVLKSEINSNRF